MKKDTALSNAKELVEEVEKKTHLSGSRVTSVNDTTADPPAEEIDTEAEATDTSSEPNTATAVKHNHRGIYAAAVGAAVTGAAAAAAGTSYFINKENTDSSDLSLQEDEDATADETALEFSADDIISSAMANVIHTQGPVAGGGHSNHTETPAPEQHDSILNTTEHPYSQVDINDADNLNQIADNSIIIDDTDHDDMIINEVIPNSDDMTADNDTSGTDDSIPDDLVI